MPSNDTPEGAVDQFEDDYGDRVRVYRRGPRSPRVIWCWLGDHDWVSNDLCSYRCDRCGRVVRAFEVNYGFV